MNKIITLFICIAFVSCRKDGTGGKADITASVFHHSKAISGAAVYIKYDATEFPGTNLSNYDNHLTAASNSNTVSFTDLRYGNYYLYGIGYDSSEKVSGGIPIQIKWNERKKEMNIYLPVTE